MKKTHGRLVVSRQAGESVRIGDSLVTILRTERQGRRVLVEIRAPLDVRVERSEGVAARQHWREDPG